MTKGELGVCGGPLQGYKGLDLTDLKGQLCGRLLADLGMEIVKVEPPGGDPVRSMGPFLDCQDGSKFSLRFAHLNANKQSIVLNLETAEGRAALLRLVGKVDVVLESFSPGFLDTIHLGYSKLAAANPGLVMASISPFGQTGPRRDYACADIVVNAMGGLMYLSGDPSLPPCKPPETLAYYFGSLFATLGVLAALFRRECSGLGDYIDVSMQECLATMEHTIRLYANDGQILQRSGSQHAHAAPGNIFPCRDGYVYLYIGHRHWKALLGVWTDHPPEFNDAEWVPNPYRRARADQINQAMERFTEQYTKQELTDLFQSHGIPCTPVNSPQEFITDEQVRARQLFVPVHYQGLGMVRQPSAPFLINGRRPAVGPAPILGEHQAAVRQHLRKAGESERRPGGQGVCPDSALPLSGVRILSFDQVLAGPYGMMLLAELGAEVIKVESRHGGLDSFRFFGADQNPNLSPRFLEFNRNKRSLTVNLKHPRGRQVIRDLVPYCDVVVDNFSVHVMPKLGLDYQKLIHIKPDIIVLRMPGLGGTGPKRDYVTLGTNITAFTGYTYLWNHPGRTNPPIGSQTVVPDYISGILAALLIVAALLQHRRTGWGAEIDLSHAEATAFLIGASLMEALASGQDPEPLGNGSVDAVPHGCYPCRGEDRWCVIAIESEAQWQALAQVIRRPDLTKDARFSSLQARTENRAELDALIESWTRDQEAHEVMEQVQRVGVPCGVVQNGADLVSDEQLAAREFLVEQVNERVGRVVLPGFPIRFANCSIGSKWEFPVLGRDTEAICRELLGYDSERIGELARERALD